MFDSVKDEDTDLGRNSIIVLLHKAPRLLMRNQVQAFRQFSVCKQIEVRIHSPYNPVEFSASEMHLAVLNKVDTPIQVHKKCH